MLNKICAMNLKISWQNTIAYGDHSMVHKIIPGNLIYSRVILIPFSVLIQNYGILNRQKPRRSIPHFPPTNTLLVWDCSRSKLDSAVNRKFQQQMYIQFVLYCCLWCWSRDFFDNQRANTWKNKPLNQTRLKIFLK